MMVVLAFAFRQCDNLGMKAENETKPHPGPWRFMRVDSGLVGILIAIAFLVMGFVSMPVATWFVVGAILVGGLVALLLRFYWQRLESFRILSVIGIYQQLPQCRISFSVENPALRRRPYKD
jgi:uncharacterized membrane-anchored protein